MGYASMMSQGEGREELYLNTSFTLNKRISFKSNDDLLVMVDKLERLKKENFNRVLIPKFKYHIESDNVLSYDVDFIKGYPVGTSVAPFSGYVYEDVLSRESEWTFTDYHMTNFILEVRTEKIYAVDFQSYSYIPDRNLRNRIWENCQKTHRTIFGAISNGTWISPAIDYDH